MGFGLHGDWLLFPAPPIPFPKVYAKIKICILKQIFQNTIGGGAKYNSESGGCNSHEGFVPKLKDNYLTCQHICFGALQLHYGLDNL